MKDHAFGPGTEVAKTTGGTIQAHAFGPGTEVAKSTAGFITDRQLSTV